MMSNVLLSAVPRALALPLYDDREIDCPAAGALFHQPV